MKKQSLIVITTLLSSTYAVKIENTQKVSIALKTQEEIQLHAGQKTASQDAFAMDGCLEWWVPTNYFGVGEKGIGLFNSAAECVEKAKTECPEFDLVNTQTIDSQNCYCQQSHGESLAEHSQPGSHWRTCRIKALPEQGGPYDSYGGPYDSYGGPYSSPYGSSYGGSSYGGPYSSPYGSSYGGSSYGGHYSSPYGSSYGGSSYGGPYSSPYGGTYDSYGGPYGSPYGSHYDSYNTAGPYDGCDEPWVTVDNHNYMGPQIRLNGFIDVYGETFANCVKLAKRDCPPGFDLATTQVRNYPWEKSCFCQKSNEVSFNPGNQWSSYQTCRIKALPVQGGSYDSYGGPYDGYGGPYSSPYGSSYGGSSYGGPYSSPYGSSYGGSSYGGPYSSPYGSSYGGSSYGGPYSSPYGSSYGGSSYGGPYSSPYGGTYDSYGGPYGSPYGSHYDSYNTAGPYDGPEPQDDDGCLEPWVTTQHFRSGQKQIAIDITAAECVALAKRVCPPGFDLANTEVSNPRNCFCQKSNGESPAVHHYNRFSGWRTCRIKALPEPEAPADEQPGCLGPWVQTNKFGPGERNIGRVNNAAECAERVKAECPGFDLANTQVSNSRSCYCQRSRGGNVEDHYQSWTGWRTCQVR